MPSSEPPIKLLITAGPTQEPIDSVRFIGNRSSGTLGCALADRAADDGWDVRVLLGPTHREPAHDDVEIHRFRTTDDLRDLLAEHVQWCDVLVMAAAVADYRPAADEVALDGKRRRTGSEMVLRLEPTPDLLAEVASARLPGQILVGFALEPRAEMLESARRKLDRKSLDLIVANPLETMDSGQIEATLLGTPGLTPGTGTGTPGRISKVAFARWLLDQIRPIIEARIASTERSAESSSRAPR